ncbi:hypothetical protein ONK29_27780, partial [Salmonella enterica subsp. enterica serovar Anatum]|nr:hypothetical protein [Salmonella enterica subsp. enterica serovar Anatum]
PLSQSLLLNNYPPAKRSIALALWSMTVIVAPICGPILGGYISGPATTPCTTRKKISIFRLLDTPQAQEAAAKATVDHMNSLT